VLFIEKQVSHALVYSNTARVAKHSNILAVIRICYTNGDAISIAYTNMAGDKKGFETSYAPVFVGSVEVKVPMISGTCMKDLVILANRALEAVKKDLGNIPGGKVFKVHKVAQQTVITEIEGPGAWL